MEKLKSLKIALCQMKVEPGRPDLNAAYIIQEVTAAEKRGIDIIVFPEMSTTGYIVGDIFEDDCFIADVQSWNNKIIEATKNKNITAIFGTVISFPAAKRGQVFGEDGRQRKHNAAIIANNGLLVRWVVKTLQPTYRFFPDEKHFYSGRKIAQEQNTNIHNILSPVEIPTRLGLINIGVILCEDMWHKDYYANPTKILADKGAEIVFNLSASPWTWQKNRKRHQIVKDLLSECQVPFVYVNNTGAQNTGKNIIVFDGSSAVYNKSGEIIFEIPPYRNGSHDFVFEPGKKPVEARPQNDTEELYSAIVCATKSIVPDGTKVIVGLSGGIDSAVVAALMTDVLGPERVIAVNMPMPFNSQKTRDMAEIIAKNLGIKYEVRPIDKLVDEVCRLSGVEPGTLAHENVQARARQNVLAAMAQKLDARFAGCSNKTEIAFGYGTLYGDIAGFFTPLGDSVKREVRQVADYINRVRFKREVIPQECIDQTPTAELKHNQKDPFHYGNLNFRGYHDEMIRAFVEFRKNPEWFLQKYIKGELEQELKLEPGTLAKLFPTARDFVQDLRRWWAQFHQSYFKRVQCPPIPIDSKRGFGRDLEESMMSTHFTQKFLELEKQLLPQIAVFGGSMNPPGLHHKIIIEELAKIFDKVWIVPRGVGTDKPTTGIASPSQRKEMTKLAFRNMLNVEFDFYDLDNNAFTPTHALQERYASQFKNAEIWFAVGGDLVLGGSKDDSEIQTLWQKGKEIWQNLNFAVISHSGYPVNLIDLPPHVKIIKMKTLRGRSTDIREKLSRGESVDNLLLPEVVRYIEENKLYR